MTTPTKQAVKRRQAAPLTEQAKMILRSVRRQLQQEQQQQADRQRQETIARVRATVQPKGVIAERYLQRTHVDPAELAFQKVVIPRTTAVLSSEGIRATVNVKMDAARNSGWTDYTNINVTMAKGIEADPRNASAVLRGVLYHEGGHIKRTVPLPVLINRYNEAIKGTGRARLTGADMRTYHTAWNIAEDQRMEMLVVDDSPNKARYFVPMVLDIVMGQFKALQTLRQMTNEGHTVTDEEMAKALDDEANCYPYLAWRRYMAKDLRRGLRAKYIARYGIDQCRAIEKSLTSYMRATDPIQTIDAIIAYHNALNANRMTILIDNHDGMTGGYFGDLDQDDAPPITGDIDIDDDDDDEPGFDMPDMPEPEDMSWVPPSEYDTSIDGDDEQEGEDDGPGMNPDDTDDEAAPTQQPTNEDVERDSTNIDDGDFGPEDVERMLNEAIEERNADPVLNEMAREFNSTMACDVPGSKLLPLHSTAETNVVTVGTAMTLAEQLEEAFHAVTIEAAPTWREQQTRGVLNVARYLTRQHGDREFFRDFDGGEGSKPGHDMAVSVLLDYSGSMGGSEAELAAVAYAMKAACDSLDIPCTVVLWDHQAKLLWDGEDRAEHVPVFSAQGGTDPTIALSDIVNHRYDRENHVVLIMTDGGFSTPDGYLNHYRHEGTFFIGSYYKHGTACTPRDLQELSSKGFDIVHGVQHLGELVNLLEQALCESVKIPVSS